MTRPNPAVSVLAELQHDFANAARDLRELPSADFECRIVPGGTLDAAGALAVYRSGYLARLREQLGETYATVWRAVGDEEFLRTCAAYIASHPSSSYNLSDYGRGFPAWLAASPLSTTHPFVAELAAFELAFHDLFHAEVTATAEPSQLARIVARGDLGGVRLRFGGALKIVALRHAVYDLFQHRDREAEPDIDVDRRQWVMLYRQESDVRAIEIGEGTFVAIEAMAAGAAVEEALALASRRDSAFGEPEASALFGLLVSTGVVAEWIG